LKGYYQGINAAYIPVIPNANILEDSKYDHAYPQYNEYVGTPLAEKYFKSQ
jgi:hypothetical protein